MTRTAERLPRFRRDPEAIRSMQVTQRDRNVISLVARHRFLRSTHLRDLTGGPTVSAVTPPATFTATAHISGTDVIVHWPAQSGISYSVQWSDDLRRWTNVPVGQTGMWTDANVSGTGGRRFYRVVR